jgi:hypothetical protein
MTTIVREVIGDTTVPRTGPHANSAICKFLNERVRALAHIKSPQEIATELGYSRPNYFLMILNGDTRLPLDKVQLLTKALQVDQKLLFRLALEAHFPSLSGFLDEVFEVDHLSRAN